MDTLNEKRKHPRVKPEGENRVEIHLLVFNQDGISSYDKLHAIDLSMGGMAISRPVGFDDSIENGNEVDLVISLPGEGGQPDIFEARGIIKRIERGGQTNETFAVQFSELKANGISILNKFINERLDNVELR